MSARSLRRYNRERKERGNIDRRNQGKREIGRALDSRANDFADDARKISELYKRFAAEKDLSGFAEAVMHHVNNSSQLSAYTAEFSAVIDRYSYLQLPHDQDQQTITPRKLDACKTTTTPEQTKEASQREQDYFGSMYKEMQELLNELAAI